MLFLPIIWAIAADDVGRERKIARGRVFRCSFRRSLKSSDKPVCLFQIFPQHTQEGVGFSRIEGCTVSYPRHVQNEIMHPEASQVFQEALAIEDPQQRRAYLERRCVADDSLKSRILELLEAFQRSDFLEETRLQVQSLISEVEGGTLAGTNVGPFRVVELVGEGGMGEVYLAQYQREGRLQMAALKVIKPGLESRQVQSRFQLEQRAMECLDHPNIARFLQAGKTESGLPYFAMEWVEGMPINEYCKRFALRTDDRLALFLDLCAAVQHAHENGIIHRDLKPSNILVGRRGSSAILKVIDFGISKALMPDPQSDIPHTRFRQWLGTPNYMSPEQAHWSPDVDARTDVYSMGVILFELLIGRMPFARGGGESSPQDCWRTTAEAEPPRPSQIFARMGAAEADEVCRARRCDAKALLATLRCDLDWVVLKAIDPRADQRYASASAMAADVDAVLGHRRPSAGPPSTARRLSRWYRRNARVIQSAGLFGSAALSLVFVLLYQSVLQSTKTKLHQASQVEQHLSARLSNAHFLQDIKAAGLSIPFGHSAEVQKNLREWQAESSPFGDHFLLNFLRQLDFSPTSILQGHRSGILSMDISADGRSIVSGDSAGDIVVWDRETGAVKNRMHPADCEVTRVCVSPSGAEFVSAGTEKCIRLWSVADGICQHKFGEHEGTINGLDWSLDGQWLASGDRTGSVSIWDVKSRSKIKTLPQHGGPVRVLRWSPSGSLLATADSDQVVNLWSIPEWTLYGQVDSLGKGPLAIGFSPDGRTMVFGGYRRGLTVFDIKTKRVLQRLETNDQICSIEFIDNHSFIVGGSTASVRLFLKRAKGWQPTRWESTGEPGWIRSIRIDVRNNQFYVASEQDASIRAFPISALTGLWSEPQSSVSAKSTGQSNLQVECGQAFSGARLVPQDTQQTEFRISDTIVPLCTPRFSSHHDRVFIGTKAVTSNAEQYFVGVYRRDDGSQLAKLTFPGMLRELELSDNDQYLAGTGWSGQVRVWDAQTLHATDLTQGSGVYEAVAAFVPNKNLLIVGGAGTDRLSCVQTGTWETVRDVYTKTTWGSMRLTPDGKWLVVGESNGISVWNSDLSDQLWSVRLPTLYEQNKVSCLAIAPDNSLIAGYCHGGLLRFWDARSRTEVMIHQLPELAVQKMDFIDSQTLRVDSPEGTYFLKCSR